MSEIEQSLHLTISDIEKVRDGLLSQPPIWPEPGAADVIGAQLLLAAMRAGQTPPKPLLDDPEVARLWAALALDTVMPLSN
ncbi:hypothetical protein [Tropicibacter sp. S64]|uniref:hypothetical protein n=1 Tax=Tropicibacter sp. S64 TaxID=3415122 RepID=UPI003C79C2A3